MRSVLVVLLGVLIAACSGGGGGGGGSTAGVGGPPASGEVFSSLPIVLEEIRYVTGLGHLRPPDHTLPTPHAYLYWRDPDLGEFPSPEVVITVRSPGGGVVSSILEQGGEQKLTVQVDARYSWYLDHIVLDPQIVVGTRLVPGQQLGTTSPLAYAIDLGLIDEQTEQPFIAPARYGVSLHAVSPWTGYADALRALVDARSRVQGADKDGAICHDLAGTLAGNWFLDGVPDTPDAEQNPANWPKQLAFARDEFAPSRWRISIGGTISDPQLLAIADGDPLPVAISPASGLRIIRCYGSLAAEGTSVPTGWLLVQMDGNGVLRAAWFSAVDHPPTGAWDYPVQAFDGSERIYRRQQGTGG